MRKRRIDRGERVLGPPQLERGSGELLDRVEAELSQSADLRLRELVVGELGER